MLRSLGHGWLYALPLLAQRYFLLASPSCTMVCFLPSSVYSFEHVCFFLLRCVAPNGLIRCRVDFAVVFVVRFAFSFSNYARFVCVYKWAVGVCISEPSHIPTGWYCLSVTASRFQYVTDDRFQSALPICMLRRGGCRSVIHSCVCLR